MKCVLYCEEKSKIVIEEYSNPFWGENRFFFPDTLPDGDAVRSLYFAKVNKLEKELNDLNEAYENWLKDNEGQE